jgi:hypothetical protein
MSAIELPALTPAQVAEINAAAETDHRHVAYLTMDGVAEMFGKSRQSLNLASMRQDIFPDALLETGRRGRPPFLFKASTAKKFGKQIGWI